MTFISKEWEGFFNPADPALWAMGSDVDWIHGDYIYSMMEHDKLHETAPWIVRNKQSAIKLVRENDRAVLAILGALMAWRILTISQMQSGLVEDTQLPCLERDIPGLYGAMLRLGLIDVGFSPRERLERIEIQQVWLSLGKNSKLVRNISAILGDKITGSDKWITSTLFSGSGFFSRRHARHNTFAAHTALTAIRHPDVELVTGDGWGSFRRIDKNACDAANLTGLSATDVVLLSRQHTTCCIEVQAAGINNKDKLTNWMNFLSQSPMPQRGILCIWLTIPNTSGTQPNLSNDLISAGRTPTASIGDPSVGQRMGIAKWDEWFTPEGLPTDHYGDYQDLFGVKQNIFNGWSQYAPQQWGTVDSVTTWGWDSIHSLMSQEWGLNSSSWKMPEYLRGGFYGFTKGVRSGQ